MALSKSYIDLSYFTGDIYIPNIDIPAKQEQLENLVTECQSEFLTALFGFKFFDTVLGATDFGVNPIVGNTSIYTSLIQGAYYFLPDGQRTIQEGLTGQITNVTGGFRRSPIAYYCYCKWIERSATNTLGSAEYLPSAENSTLVSSAYKYTHAWNKMVDLLWNIHAYIMYNEASYPDYIGIEYPPILNPTTVRGLEPNQELFVKEYGMLSGF